MVWAPDFVYLVLFCKCAEMNTKKNGKTEEGTLLLLNNPFHLNEKTKIIKTSISSLLKFILNSTLSLYIFLKTVN